MTLPEALLHHQTQHLMTQTEYAKHLGVSLSALQFWLAGRTPSQKMARKLIEKGVDRSAVMRAVHERAKGRAA